MSNGNKNYFTVIAIRIYYDAKWGVLADLRMSDGVTETIHWTDVKQRKQFADKINGYTLWYDERPKCAWEKAH